MTNDQAALIAAAAFLSGLTYNSSPAEVKSYANDFAEWLDEREPTHPTNQPNLVDIVKI